MPILADPDGGTFSPSPYRKESELEADVRLLADSIFGPTSIYIDTKKKMGGSIVTIPDAYLIDLANPTDPKLYIIENEIYGHDPFKHIGIQMLKFVTSFDEAQRSIFLFLRQEIWANQRHLSRLDNALQKQKTSENKDHYLDRAVAGEFRGIVVIDEASDELHRVLKNIRAPFSVIELRAFVNEDGRRMFHHDTLYDEESISEFEEPARELSSKNEARAARRERRASSDTIVVPAREDGFEEVFLKQNEWHAVRISPAMKDRIRSIAVYRTAPTSAITHIASIKEVRPYKETGKYQIIFSEPAKQIKPIPLAAGAAPPRAPFYTRSDKLLSASSIDDLLTN